MVRTGQRLMDKSSKYLIVIPAFDEERTIASVINDVRKNIPYADILVVNDGSSDRTSAITKGMDVKVIDHPFNLGYGAALQTGFKFASKNDYDFVITMDADGQHVPSSVESLLAVMQRERADVVIGSRFLERGYRVGILRKFGINLFSRIARIYTGINITDPTSGFQLLNRYVFSYLAEGDNYPLDYPDVNIIMALHKMKFRVAESPVAMIESQNGKSMHSGLKPVLYVIKMLLAIVMVILRRVER